MTVEDGACCGGGGQCVSGECQPVEYCPWEAACENSMYIATTLLASLEYTIEQACTTEMIGDTPERFCECQDVVSPGGCNPCHNGGTCIQSYDSLTCECPSTHTGPYCTQPTCGGATTLCSACEKCVFDECVPDETATCDLGPFVINEVCIDGSCNGTVVCPNGSEDCPSCSPGDTTQCRYCSAEGYFLPDPTQIGNSCDDGNSDTLNDVCQADGTCEGEYPPCFFVTCDPCHTCVEGECISDTSAGGCHQCFACEQTCNDNPVGWVDSIGRNCDWYAANDQCEAEFCDYYASLGLTAKIACCACGGGSYADAMCEVQEGIECDDGNELTLRDTCNVNGTCVGNECSLTCDQGGCAQEDDSVVCCDGGNCSQDNSTVCVCNGGNCSQQDCETCFCDGEGGCVQTGCEDPVCPSGTCTGNCDYMDY